MSSKKELKHRGEHSNKNKKQHFKESLWKMLKVGKEHNVAFPSTCKETDFSENAWYRIASTRMQGWRPAMEDFHTQILSLDNDAKSAYFAVYDGHGGSAIAKHAQSELHNYIFKREEYKDDIAEAMKRAFQEMDMEMMCSDEFSSIKAGSTAVAVIIKDDVLYCANLGDSRAIGCANGEMVVLSLDHKPKNKFELQRIVEAGGQVKRGCINGSLALSRALGDFHYKRNFEKEYDEQMVIAYPDVRKFPIDESWEFLLLASDGVWDVMSRDVVCDFCRERIAKNMKPEEICEQLLNNCLDSENDSIYISRDNMTVILVCFLHNKPYNILVEHCAKQFTPTKALVDVQFFIKPYPDNKFVDTA